MLERDNREKLEDVEKNLYSRVERPQTIKPIAPLSKENVETVDHWEHPPGEEKIFSNYPKKVSSFSKKVMIFSLIFFILALIFGFFIYYRGANVFSSDNIEINILGPVSIGGGEVLDLDVDIKNDNNTSLEDATLKIEYPEGTRKTGDITTELKRQQESLGNILQGGDIHKKISAVLFGEENSKKEIQISVEYRVKNSNAIYEKIKKFEIALTSAPVSLKVSSLKEVNSGQDVEFTVDLTSNSSQVIKNLVLKAEYAFGFIFKDATPKPFFDNNIWQVGDLKPGEKRQIKIKGQVEGQDGEERVFRFYAGLGSLKDEKLVDPVFLSGTQSLTIKKPFIGINLVLDGQTVPIYVTTKDRSIRGDVEWENNLPSEISDAEIKVKITGNVDKTSVTPSQGFYNSSDNTILWNSGTLSSLKLLTPGGKGTVSFSLAPLLPNLQDAGRFKNLEILLSVSAKGKRLQGSSVPEEIISTASAKVRVESDLSLAPEISYVGGPFKNTGPLPPQVEKETTYTVTWTIQNTFNDVRNATVSATLPPYVKWKNATSPPNEKISYNPGGGKILWDVGDVGAGEGTATAGRKVSFQVSFLPSVSQAGTVPVIINQATISGVDRFTETTLRQQKDSLTTRISGDLNSEKNATVVK